MPPPATSSATWATTATSSASTVYGSGWPYGRIEPFLSGLGEGEARGRAEAALAEALLAHGRQVPAARFVGRARADCPGCPEVARAARLAELLSPLPRSQPEVPLEADDDPLELPRLPASLPPEELEHALGDWTRLLDELRRHRYAHALQAVARWPERQLDEAGPDVALAVGFLLYKLGLEDDALDLLKPLGQDPAAVRRRPAILYYLARSLYGDGLFAAGVREMRRYLAAAPPGPSEARP